ncbi:2'-5' RNA ligase family protein [Actinoplanes sp. CA-252034]|uniref:2'-5' RNA ligase family protein n=1 Tax=Actinoplanes sp. CA-252034 TaxID=3239906 RepID=UPI003D9555B9
MRRHLTILLAGPPATLLESRRQTWDPVMAAVVPAHVTLLYPEEALIRQPAGPTPRPEIRDGRPAQERVLEPRQVEEPIAGTAPFRLRLGAIITLDEGQGGVFVAVQDVDGAWAHLRHRILGQAPGLTSGFPPHATIVHPRTSSRGPECWEALRGSSLSGEFTISEIVHTTTTAEAFTIEQRFPLLRAPDWPSRTGPAAAS